jgi:hypothetical protein
MEDTIRLLDQITDGRSAEMLTDGRAETFGYELSGGAMAAGVSQAAHRRTAVGVAGMYASIGFKVVSPELVSAMSADISATTRNMTERDAAQQRDRALAANALGFTSYVGSRLSVLAGMGNDVVYGQARDALRRGDRATFDRIVSGTMGADSDAYAAQADTFFKHADADRQREVQQLISQGQTDELKRRGSGLEATRQLGRLTTATMTLGMTSPGHDVIERTRAEAEIATIKDPAQRRAAQEQLEKGGVSAWNLVRDVFGGEDERAAMYEAGDKAETALRRKQLGSDEFLREAEDRALARRGITRDNALAGRVLEEVRATRDAALADLTLRADEQAARQADGGTGAARAVKLATSGQQAEVARRIEQLGSAEYLRREEDRALAEKGLGRDAAQAKPVLARVREKRDSDLAELKAQAAGQQAVGGQAELDRSRAEHTARAREGMDEYLDAGQAASQQLVKGLTEARERGDPMLLAILEAIKTVAGGTQPVANLPAASPKPAEEQAGSAGDGAPGAGDNTSAHLTIRILAPDRSLDVMFTESELRQGKQVDRTV